MKKRRKINKTRNTIITAIIMIIIAIYSYFNSNENNQTQNTETDFIKYNGNIYEEVNNNIPEFTEEDKDLKQDYYSELKNGRVRNGNDKNKLEKSK